MTFHKRYFIAALILFAIEIGIAVFVHDNFIRPFGGDFLVVILIYCCVKSFCNISVLKAAIGVLAFAFFVEILQGCELIYKLGLEHSTAAKLVLGNSFSWVDLLTYIAGIVVVLLAEMYSKNLKNEN